MKKTAIFTTLICITSSIYADNEDWTINSSLQLKNLYVDRDFETGQDIGSWSQGSIFNSEVKKDYGNFTLSILPHIQYAYRLSSDKHVSDAVFAFDNQNSQQERQYYKLGLGLKLENKHQYLVLGDLKLNHPITAADPTRQLTPMYQGAEYGHKLSNDGLIQLGYVDKYSPRNDGDFHDLAVSGQKADGLYYVNYSIKSSLIEHDFYYGNLINLFHQVHYGANLKNKFDLFDNELKIKLFNIHESGDALLGDLNTSYYGVMNTFSKDIYSLGIGYQMIDGNSNFYLMDGAVPGTHFINWTQGAFNKADEKSLHINAKVNLDSLLKGLSFNYRYMYGDNFKTANVENKEIERDYIVNYNASQFIKGLNMQLIYVNYDIKQGRDYDELRALTTYTFKF